MATNLGHTLAKLLGIKLNYRDPTNDGVTRGESAFSVSTADTYVEEEPTALEWIKHVTPGPRDVGLWAYHLFPFVHWITRYNLQWLSGDLIAGTDSWRLIAIQDFLTLSQALPWVASWSRSRWHTPRWPSWTCNLASTRHSWVC